jgi:molybdopterin-containing oxidoreductase family membrane subunit
MQTQPMWHSTIFAPYFVAGAIHSGLAMVLTLMIPMRKIFRYEAFITKDILDNIAKTIVFTGLIVGYAYAVEYFLAWYSHNIVEQESFRWRALGPYGLQFWIMVICNSVVPLLFFLREVRRSIPLLFTISILINIGMWYERFVIIIGGVAHDFMPNAWGAYSPTIIEYGILIGSFSLFFFLFLLFVKHLPSVSMTELKESAHKGESHGV